MNEDTNPFTPQGKISTTQTKRRGIFKSLFKIISALLLLGLLVAGVTSYIFHSLNVAPDSFPTNQPIVIEPGMDVRSITETLAQANVVRSSSLLYYTLVLFYDPTAIKASTYVFDEPLPTTIIAKRLTEGDFDTDLIRFTHFEGESVTQLVERADEVLPDFDAEKFLANAKPQEGKLFPDTYFIPSDYTDENLLDLLHKTFDEKIAPLKTEIASSSLSLDEIIILASIIEREANTPESMKMVSGILQNRLTLGMPLQADASIEYILDKPLSELTAEDLDIDSPYNTYLYPGLPPTPIGNPGLEAITAVLEPTPSDYYYYLTDSDGDFHYSKTYTEHLRNIEKYLR